MAALNILGLVCLLLFCFLAPITLIINTLKDDGTLRRRVQTTGEAHKSHVHWGDYLLIGLLIALLLIGVFTNDREERLISYSLLGLGYAYFLLVGYSNRLDIRWVNRAVCLSTLTIASASGLLSLTNDNFQTDSGDNVLIALLLPLTMYAYISAARSTIKRYFNTYPLTLDRYFGVGDYHVRYNRNATRWDMLWTIWNSLCVPLVVFFAHWAFKRC